MPSELKPINVDVDINQKCRGKYLRILPSICVTGGTLWSFHRKLTILLDFSPMAALNPLSCQAYKNVQSVQQKANILIDVDGSGPLNPFPVTCEFYCKTKLLLFTLFTFTYLLI